MSVALIQSIEEVLITANTRLSAEIKAEKDPKRLETLLTLAYRVRVPRSHSTPTTPRPPRSPERPEPNASGSFPSPFSNPKSAIPNPQSTPSPSPTRDSSLVAHTSASPSPNRQSEIPNPQSPASISPTRDSSLVAHTSSPPPAAPLLAAILPPPTIVLDERAAAAPAFHITPMTDEQFLKLEREFGTAEATRRRRIRAHLAARAPLPAAPDEIDQLLAAAGLGVRRFGERIAHAPSEQPAPAPQATPSTHSTHSASDTPPPWSKPYTDAEYEELERKMGFPEANRRRLIRLTLAYQLAAGITDSS